MKTVAIMNPKGGTGKTLTAYGLSAGLARRGYKVLAVDADWQRSLSEMVEKTAPVSGVSLRDLISGEGTCSCEELSVSPAGFHLIQGDPNLYGLHNVCRKNALADVLKALEDKFDYCIIDAPPCLGHWAECILGASQEIIVPDHMGSILALYYMDTFCKCIEKVRKHQNPELCVAGVLYTEAEDDPMARPRERANLLNRAAEQLKTGVYDTAISYESCAPAYFTKSNIFESLPGAGMVLDYDRFVDEFLAKEAQA